MLEVVDLGKTYAVQNTPRARLRQLLTGRGGGRRQAALSNVSFRLDHGHCLGVVGDNGAGKSTLLKLIAGTLLPSTGTVRRDGRLTAILELGAGFHQAFSGRQNIHFAGALMGIPEAEMRALEADIIAFAELEEAIDRPVKTYSSGMVVRLAFALVTSVSPDILIIDEALAVGDQHFQKKCVERIEAFRNAGCTILFCSHSLYHVRRLCDRAIWLDHGQVRAQGDTETVLAGYETHVRAQDRPAPQGIDRQALPRAPERRAAIESVTLASLDDATPPRLTSPHLEITLVARALGDEVPHLAIMLNRADGVGVMGVGTHLDGATPVSLGDGRWRSVLTFPDLPLYSGEYTLSAYLFDADGVLVYDEWPDCQRFLHVVETLEVGLVRLPHRWS
jgi:lipopolysaccharide transport system ATP-binding protein